uniref:Uncharacterized protein n=2 Tax=Klebsiella TaxID=570 RepID=A0A345WXG7_KLEOX|nr:hypothetical protein [Klebsiella oxytoca]QVQ57468.1 hypothetical protein [Klebsiella pneumoniae]
MFPLADMQNSRCLCAAQVRKVTFFPRPSTQHPGGSTQ